MERTKVVQVGSRRPEQRGDAAVEFHLTQGPHGPCLYAIEVVERPTRPAPDGDWPHDDE